MPAVVIKYTGDTLEYIFMMKMRAKNDSVDLGDSYYWGQKLKWR